MLSLIVGVLTLVAAAPVHAAEPTGIWLVQDRTAKVRIMACGEALCGTVIWLSQPNDKATGKPQTDKLNSDPQMRMRPMLGVPVLISMQRGGEDNKWSGQIYNPDDGNTYRGTIEFLNPTQLKVRACVAIYCQSEIWVRSQ